MTADVRAGTAAIDVSHAKLTVSNLHVVGAGWNINEPRVELAGDLRWNGTSGELASNSSQLVSSTVSLAAKDVRLQASEAGSPRAAGAAAFRADLARLAAWRSSPGQPSPYQPTGMVTGNLRFDQQADRITSELTATGETVALQQLSPSRGVQSAYQTIWQEPQVNVRGTTSYEPAADRLAFRQLQVQSTTLAVMADGQIDRLSTTADVNANGSLNYDLALVTPLLKPLVGEGIQLVGRETAKFQATGSLRPTQAGSHWSRTLQARGELPWTSANVYGLPIGPGKLAATLGGGLVRVDPLSIAVAEGQLTTAPQVRLDPEPMELTLPPGPVLTNVRISPQVSEAMLKYIAPVLAGATQSEGLFSLSLSGARVPLANATKADVAGQMTVHSVRVVPGPMAKQWVELAQQIESIAKRRAARGGPTAAGDAALGAGSASELPRHGRPRLPPGDAVPGGRRRDADRRLGGIRPDGVAARARADPRQMDRRAGAVGGSQRTIAHDPNQLARSLSRRWTRARSPASRSSCCKARPSRRSAAS